MQAAEGRAGRVFVLRLDAEDELPGCLERFAAENGIIAAQVVVRAHGQAGGASSTAVGALMLDENDRAFLSLSGPVVPGQGEGALPVREALIQEWLGLHLSRPALPGADTPFLPITRAPGMTQAIKKSMLRHVRQGMVTEPIHAPARPGGPHGPIALKMDAARPQSPPEPASVAIYLCGAELA